MISTNDNEQMKLTNEIGQMTSTDEIIDESDLVVDDFDSHLESNNLRPLGVVNGHVLLDSHMPPTDDEGNIENTISGLHYTKCENAHQWHGVKGHAATFTYPIEHVIKTVKETRWLKNGREIQTKKYLYLKDIPQKEQFYYFKDMFNKMNERLYKKFNFFIIGFELYPEFTKAGLIHIHGMLWFQPEGWAIGRCHAIASEWVRLTKGTLRALMKHNANGTTDYAIAPCQDIEAWMQYAKKESKNKNNLLYKSI